MNNSRNQYHSGGNEETMKKNQNYVLQEQKKQTESLPREEKEA